MIKNMLLILCLFALSCDNDNGNGSNDVEEYTPTPIEEFQYPLSIGNQWNYMIETTWTPSESFDISGSGVINDYSDTTIVDTSFITITVNDIVTIQDDNLGIVYTEDDVFELNYHFSGNYTKDFLNPEFVEYDSKFYLKNTIDSLVFIAAEDLLLMYNLPGFVKRDFCSDVVEYYECTPYCSDDNICIGEGFEYDQYCSFDGDCNHGEGICSDGPLVGEDCQHFMQCGYELIEEIKGMTYFNPHINLITYPVAIGNFWSSILDEDYNVTTLCSDNTVKEHNFIDNGFPMGINGYEVTKINEDNCFEITQYTHMDSLADDIEINHTLTYCTDIGLYKNEYYANLGEQIATDEFGNAHGSFAREVTRVMRLIDFIIN